MFRLHLCLSRLLSNMRSIAALASVVVAVALLGLVPSVGHEGHDHDDDVAAALVSSTYPRVTAQSELYEVVGVLKGGRLAIYIDQFATNESVTDGKVMVTIGDGEPVEAERAQDGSYSLSSNRLSETGPIEVIFAINAGSGDDLLVGSLAPPAASAPGNAFVAPIAATSSRWLAIFPSPIRNPVLLAFVSFGLGVLFGHLYRAGRVVPAMATGVAAVVVLVVLAAVALSDDDHGRTGNAAQSSTGGSMSDSPRRLGDGTVFAAKPTQRLLEIRTAAAKPETARPAVNLIGRVIGDANRTSVVQSIHGGRVVPLDDGLPRIGQAVRKGDALVQVDPYLPLADRTTISEKTREIEQLIAVAETKIRRLSPLVGYGAVPRSQVVDLETELEGLRRRREAIRNTRNELELLRAPTDGVIAAVKVVSGQVVQAQDLLFQIVDPEGLWVEALAYGALDPQSLAEATAVTAGGQGMSLSYQGFSRALQQHAAIVQFSIPAPPTNLSLGQPVTVIANTGAPVVGLIVRRDALVRGANGEAMVWLHVEPERFEPRPVRTQPFDATRVVLAAGVAEGERIVVRGADLINQIR